MADKSKSLTINDFCKEFSISRSHYYRLKAKNQLPKALRLGNKTVFLREEVAVWAEKQMSS